MDPLPRSSSPVGSGKKAISTCLSVNVCGWVKPLRVPKLPFFDGNDKKGRRALTW